MAMHGNHDDKLMRKTGSGWLSASTSRSLFSPPHCSGRSRRSRCTPNGTA